MLYADFRANEELVTALISADVSQLGQLAESANQLNRTVDAGLATTTDSAVDEPRRASSAALRFYTPHQPTHPTPLREAADADRTEVAPRSGPSIEPPPRPAPAPPGVLRRLYDQPDGSVALAHARRARAVVTAALQALAEQPAYHEVGLGVRGGEALLDGRSRAAVGHRCSAGWFAAS